MDRLPFWAIGRCLERDWLDNNFLTSPDPFLLGPAFLTPFQKMNNFMPRTKCTPRTTIPFLLEFLYEILGKLNPTREGACCPIKQLVNI